MKKDFRKMMNDCCSDFIQDNTNEKDFEVVKIEKTKAVCAQCEKATESKADTGVPIAVISCEGACLRGEVSRRVANNICFKEIPEKTFRVCLGGAFTKDTNQRKLVRNSQKVIALEGCSIMCASRMMKGVLPNVAFQPILVNQHYKIDNNLFAINDLSDEVTDKLAEAATKSILDILYNSATKSKEEDANNCGC
jgi:uncharacterized metal-binding protein